MAGLSTVLHRQGTLLKFISWMDNVSFLMMKDSLPREAQSFLDTWDIGHTWLGSFTYSHNSLLSLSKAKQVNRCGNDGSERLSAMDSAAAGLLHSKRGNLSDGLHLHVTEL